jgi:hypothetical protein
MIQAMIKKVFSHLLKFKYQNQNLTLSIFPAFKNVFLLVIFSAEYNMQMHLYFRLSTVVGFIQIRECH